MNKIYLCAIINISSGSCSEDCHFCTQSSRYGVDIPKYKEKSLDTILLEARKAREVGAVGICLVTSGKALNEKKIRFVSQSARAIRKELGSDFNLIACNGLATKEQLLELKVAGINVYNHNLESSENYYNKICSTHSWSERYQTASNVKEVGLKLVCGGIVGMGESKDDRIELIKAIGSLKPATTPLNFYHPNEALPIKNNNISFNEAIDFIRYARENLEVKKLMLAGGREHFFKDRQAEIFKAGINSIVIGDYLTTKGNELNQDLQMLESLGLSISRKCDG
jgi:biotin synthase